MVSATGLYSRTNAEVIVDFFPKPLPSPGEQSVPAPQIPVHSCLVALSSFSQSHPRPDHTPQPIPLNSKLGTSGIWPSCEFTTLHCERPQTLPSATLPSLSCSGFMRSHIMCFLAMVP